MSEDDLTKYLTHSWLELPFLVDQFVEQVASTLKCERSHLRQVVSESLGVPDLESLGRICRLMGDAYSVLRPAFDDMDVDPEHLDPVRAGTVASIIRAWHDGSEDLSELADIDPANIEPMQALPWRLWARWQKTDTAYFSPSWTPFQADRGRCFSGFVDGISV